MLHYFIVELPWPSIKFLLRVFSTDLLHFSAQCGRHSLSLSVYTYVFGECAKFYNSEGECVV